MKDKELLELAAKAIGRTDLLIVSEFIQGDFRDGLWDDLNEVVWNPLTDDGDALRLAVKLELLMHVETCYYVHCMKEQTHVTEHIGNDGSGCLYEATRRAIVRAAAEIGKCIS